MGFNADDIASTSDSLVDALVAWGDADAIASRVGELQAAGADHVAIRVVSASPQPTPEEWRRAAHAVLGR